MSYKQINYLSEEEIEILHQLFDFLDQGSEGKIKVNDLIRELRRFDFDKSDPIIFGMIALVGEKSKEKIDFTTFLDAINNKFYKSNSKENLRKIFEMFEDSKSGFISMKTLQQLSEEIGDKISNDEWEEMLKSNPSLFLSFDLFYDLISNLNNSVIE